MAKNKKSGARSASTAKAGSRRPSSITSYRDSDGRRQWTASSGK